MSHPIEKSFIVLWRVWEELVMRTKNPSKYIYIYLNDKAIVVYGGRCCTGKKL